MKKSKKMRTIPKKSNGPNIFERMQMRRVEKDAYTSIIADSFCGVNWHEKLKIFPVFTVYKNVRDFPGKYGVRLFDGTRPMRLITIRDTLDEARATIPEGFYCVQKSPDDDPVIVETWL